jgi:uncharacterized protein
MLRRCFQFCCCLLVWLGSTGALAGSYEDFFAAIAVDDPAVVAALLERGFDPNTPGEKGDPALTLALKASSFKTARVLIENAATALDATNAANETPLMLAALRGNAELCQLLIERDADVNRPGWAPLHYAATSAALPVMRMLLEAHAYVDAESPNGTTPLMMAARYGNAQAVALLLEFGADPELKNGLGLTAIDFAFQMQKLDAVERISAAIRSRKSKAGW